MRVFCLVLCVALPAAPGEDADAIDRARRLCAAQGIEVAAVTGLDVGWAAAYRPHLHRIELNLTSGHWTNAAARHANGHAIGLYSSGHRDHVIRHEIGHAKYYGHVGLAKAVWLHTQPIGLSRARIISTVSSYAAKDPVEFVAEVYSGLWAKKAYPADVMAYYNSLWAEDSN